MKDLDLFHSFGLGGTKDHDPNNRRAVIYSRVSTKGQEDNSSLANQYEVCMNYVRREDLEVVAEFGGKGESAKQGSARQEYERMLKFVRSRKNRIRYVVFYAYDRFSREGGKAIVTKQELKDMGIVVKSATMPIDTSNPYGEGMEDMQLIFAKIENDIRRKRCIDGTRQKLLSGKWCGTAPIGYYWKDGEMLIDPEKGPLVKKAFEWKANDPNLTLEEIRVRIRKRGLHIPAQTMSRLIRNPLYCGLMAHKILEGEVVPGKHKPLVSRKLFLKVNGIINEKNASGWRIDEENDLLPLKRFLTCDCCGKPLTGYLNKSKNGKPRKRPIPYYKCRTKGCGINVNANKMGDYFLSEISQYQIDEKWLPLIAQEFRATMAERYKDRFQEAETLQRRVIELDKKLKRLRERYVLEEAISQDDYREFSLQLANQKGEILKELEIAKQKSSNPLNRIDDILQLSANLSRIWTNGDYRTKQRVQKFAFPEGMVYSKEIQGVRTPRINEVIRVSSQYSTILAQKRKGSLSLAALRSHRVPEAGIEPALPFREIGF